MNGRTPQRGATLILVIGIIATLLILGAALVGLIWNTRHSTSATVTQVKVFNVAEAGLDAGQQALWLNWPAPTPTPIPSPSVTPSAFQSNFPSYRDPVSGQFIDVEFLDDDGNLTNPGISTPSPVPHIDQNGNDYMWIVSRAATGTRAAKVMALVQRVKYQPTIMSGVAIATTGPLDLRGTGPRDAIGVAPPLTSAAIYCGTFPDPAGSPDMISTPIEETTPDMITGQGGVFPDEVLANLIAAANGAGKEYATWADYTSWKSSHPGVEPFATDPRIIVIDSGDVDVQAIDNTDPASGPVSIWSRDHPGILIVLSGDLKSVGGSKRDIWGVVYVNNGMVLGGSAEIHGMVVALGSALLHGGRAVTYDQSVIDKLNQPVILSVKQVPNTWRELTP